MSPTFSRTFWIACLTGLLTCGSMNAAGAELLRMGGTGSGLELLRQLGTACAANNPSVTVEIIPSLGTSGGLSALADGALDIAVSSRSPKPEEADKGLQEFAAARTAFILVTSRSTPESFRSSEVAAAFGNADARWPDGAPIRVVLRPETESDTRLLEEFFPGMPEALVEARSHPEIPVAATDQDSAQIAEDMENSLAAATLVQIVTEERQLHPILLDGVEPTSENLEAGRYPYAKTLHFVISDEGSSAANGFAKFLISEDGAALMRTAGILPTGK